MELSILFGAIGTILGIVGALVTLKKDSKADGAEDAHVKAQVDYIARGVDDIRIDQRAQAGKIEALNERLIRTEESAKQAHKRIDSIGEKEGA
ncbi:hypothetical protein ACFSY7_02945 [Kurthia populi]|uniref:Gas vesicle protein n=1 Tax=Kurthia populi TaxID=1562132 RepID=A0ABW5XWT0_9BACL